MKKCITITIIFLALFTALIILKFLNIGFIAGLSWWQLTSPLWFPPVVAVWLMITASIFESFKIFFK